MITGRLVGWLVRSFVRSVGASIYYSLSIISFGLPQIWKISHRLAVIILDLINFTTRYLYLHQCLYLLDEDKDK